MARTDSPPEVAAARIKAYYTAAKSLAMRTGGDPAETAFELMAAACLVMLEARPAKNVADMMAEAAPSVSGCVQCWFSDEIKAFSQNDN